MDKMTVEIPGKAYPIFFGDNFIDGLGPQIKALFPHRELAVITDENVHRIYGRRISDSLAEAGFSATLIIVPAGEQSKSLQIWSSVLERLVLAGITRDDLIITLGGGVVGDMGGFAAATYLRGIPFIQVPTTLLAQIDSSIGGKVAVDLPGGKNLVGAFYQPQAVFIDQTFLETLEPRFLRDGMGEVIKYACIRDRGLFEYLESTPAGEIDYGHLIPVCCRIKKEIVQGDEMDRGERMLLNFGHTLGHALEKYYCYEKYSHGEAVAIGMQVFTSNSEAMGLTAPGTAARLLALLEKFGLPHQMPPAENEELIEAMRADKKNLSGGLHVVLLTEIGQAVTRRIRWEEPGDLLRLCGFTQA